MIADHEVSDFFGQLLVRRQPSVEGLVEHFQIFLRIIANEFARLDFFGRQFRLSGLSFWWRGLYFRQSLFRVFNSGRQGLNLGRLGALGGGLGESGFFGFQCRRLGHGSYVPLGKLQRFLTATSQKHTHQHFPKQFHQTFRQQVGRGTAKIYARNPEKSMGLVKSAFGHLNQIHFALKFP